MTQRAAPVVPREGSSSAPTSTSALRRALVFCLMSAITMGICLLTVPPSSGTVAGVVMDLPYRIGDWWGTSQGMAPAEKLMLPPDTSLVRKSYESASGDNIVCSIVLAGAEKRSIHRPEICLPAQGWTIRASEVVSIPLHSGHILKATNLTLSRPEPLPGGGQKELLAYYMYWFVGDGETTPYHWRRIWLTSWDRVVHHRNHRWAYVIVNSAISGSIDPAGKSAPETLAMMKALTADVVPSFQISEGATPQSGDAAP